MDVIVVVVVATAESSHSTMTTLSILLEEGGIVGSVSPFEAKEGGFEEEFVIVK